jgi:hypothetical protein
MKAEHFKKFERKITAAIKAHVANGGELKSGSFGFDNCLCPLSCLTGAIVPNNVTYWDRVSEICKVPFTENDMWQFIDGFDNNSVKPYARTRLYLLGRSLRAKYLPV